MLCRPDAASVRCRRRTAVVVYARPVRCTYDTTSRRKRFRNERVCCTQYPPSKHKYDNRPRCYCTRQLYGGLGGEGNGGYGGWGRLNAWKSLRTRAFRGLARAKRIFPVRVSRDKSEITFEFVGLRTTTPLDV